MRGQALKMDTWSTSVGRRLKRLTRQDCLALLASKSIGRVACCTPAGPVILPVNYAIHQGTALIRTSSSGTLAERLRDSAAALEVDDLDETTRSGWSVLLRGHASFVEYQDLPRRSVDRPQPWARGARMLHIRIVPTEISGRRLEPSDDPSSDISWLRS
jgi:nitroimidazol reductase NimA-like FMN-containing flavoprotein (pyridoxamine 5'-phosphate oxidase superfamily)